MKLASVSWLSTPPSDGTLQTSGWCHGWLHPSFIYSVCPGVAQRNANRPRLLWQAGHTTLPPHSPHLVLFLLDANEGSVTSLVFAAPWSACLFGPVTSLCTALQFHLIYFGTFFLLVHRLMKQLSQRGGRISRYDWSSQVSGKKETPQQAVLPVFTEPGEKETSMLACWEFALLARWPVLPEYNRKWQTAAPKSTEASLLKRT